MDTKRNTFTLNDNSSFFVFFFSFFFHSLRLDVVMKLCCTNCDSDLSLYWLRLGQQPFTVSWRFVGISTQPRKQAHTVRNTWCCCEYVDVQMCEMFFKWHRLTPVVSNVLSLSAIESNWIEKFIELNSSRVMSLYACVVYQLVSVDSHQSVACLNADNYEIHIYCVHPTAHTYAVCRMPKYKFIKSKMIPFRVRQIGLFDDPLIQIHYFFVFSFVSFLFKFKRREISSFDFNLVSKPYKYVSTLQNCTNHEKFQLNSLVYTFYRWNRKMMQMVRLSCEWIDRIQIKPYDFSGSGSAIRMPLLRITIFSGCCLSGVAVCLVFRNQVTRQAEIVWINYILSAQQMIENLSDRVSKEKSVNKKF